MSGLSSKADLRDCLTCTSRVAAAAQPAKRISESTRSSISGAGSASAAGHAHMPTADLKGPALDPVESAALGRPPFAGPRQALALHEGASLRLLEERGDLSVGPQWVVLPREQQPVIDAGR